MFALGASDSQKVDTFMYDAHDEDFAANDASKLDTWVFERFDALFKAAENNSSLQGLLKADKIVFFLQYSVLT